MSSYYPPRSPYYPPERNPEEEIYDEEDFEFEEDEGGRSGDSWFQRILIFLAGGCLVFFCLGCCGVLAAGAYSMDLTSLLSPTPIPGSDIGLSFNEPAYPDEAVVNEKQVRLKLLEVARNAALPTVPAVEGRELIILTVELTNLGTVEADFDEKNFLLLNSSEGAYQPTTGTDIIEGALGRGTLPPGEGLEGRMVFEVLTGEQGLVLNWDGGEGTQPRFIAIE
jgi:hypothetical protein